MPSKGFNSVLFDFDSIIDIELSTIRWISNEYRDDKLDKFDKYRLLYTSLDDMKFMRVLGYRGQDFFRSLIIDEEYQDKYKDVLKAIYNEYEKEILSESNIVKTSMDSLIKVYSKTGNGVISTAIRCDNDNQENCVRSFDKDVVIEKCKRKDVDMSKYGRLIIGDVMGAMEYVIKEPKSIAVLDFRENMSKNDITVIRPEPIVMLGDINEFTVISAYRSVNKDEILG